MVRFVSKKSSSATVAVPHNEWQRETMQEAVDSEAHWIGYALPAGAAISSPYGGYVDGEGNTMEENGFHFWAEDAVQGPVRNFDRAVLAATNGVWWMGGASDAPQTDRLRAVCQRPKAPLGLRPLAGLGVAHPPRPRPAPPPRRPARPARPSD